MSWSLPAGCRWLLFIYPEPSLLGSWGGKKSQMWHLGKVPPGHFSNKVQRHAPWTPVAVFSPRSLPHCATSRTPGRLLCPAASGQRVALLSELEGLRQGHLGCGGEGVELQSGAPRLQGGVQLEGVCSSQVLAFLSWSFPQGGP